MGRAVFLISFGLLSAFGAPGLYLRDSGELTAAAFTLGVAHETGFTLFCLLGKLATFLPVGEVATRVNLLSALCGALAAWLVYRGVRELAATTGAADERSPLLGELAGAGAAALLLGGLTFWRASTVAEVYAPTAAALALGLWLWMLTVRGVGRAGMALALVGGLSLGLHAQLRILLGPAAVVLALLRLRKGARWPLYAPLFVAVGAAVVAYLPLRAAQSPAANWADPRTLRGVLRHLSAHYIRASFADQIFSHDGRLVAERLGSFFAQVEGQVGAILLLVAAGGLVWLLLHARATGVVLAVVLLGDAIYSAWINPMGLDDLQCGAPTAVALALCAGAGLVAAARRFPRRAQPFVAASVAVMALVPALFSDVDAKLRLGPEADSFARASLVDAPPRAAVFATTDDLLAGSLYLQKVGGLRPDVTVLARQQLPNLRLRVERELAEHPMAVEWEVGSDGPPLGALEPGVPLSHLSLQPAPLSPAAPLVDRAVALLEPARDPFARRLLSGSFTSLGQIYFHRGDERQARALFESALQVRPNDAVAATNLAVVRARQGDFASALKICEEVLAREPGRQVARLNAARYRLALSDLDGAERDFRDYARRAPKEAAPHIGLSRIAARRGDKAAAERHLQEALRLQPGNAEAQALRRDLK